MKKVVAFLCIISVAILFASCGGGGGSSNSPKKLISTWTVDGDYANLENLTFIDAATGYMSRYATYTIVDQGGNATMTILSGAGTPDNEETAYVLISPTHTGEVGTWANATNFETVTIFGNNSFLVETVNGSDLTGTYSIPAAGQIIMNLNFTYSITDGVITMTGAGFEGDNFFYVVSSTTLYLGLKDQILDDSPYTIANDVLTITFDPDNAGLDPMPLPRLSGTPGTSLVGSWGLSAGGDYITFTFNKNHTGLLDMSISGTPFSIDFYWVDKGTSVEIYFAMKFNKVG
jgi:hypothetical protein